MEQEAHRLDREVILTVRPVADITATSPGATRPERSEDAEVEPVPFA